MNIHAPSVIFNEINTVVVVKTRGPVEVISNMPQLKEGSILLPADFADIHNPGYGEHAVVKGSGEKSMITNWVDANARVEWMFNASEAGMYKLEALVRADEPNRLNIVFGSVNQPAEIQATGENFDVISLGEIEISEAGDQVIALTPMAGQWKNVELMYLDLIKQ